MSMHLVTTRTVTVDECPWLDEDLPEGTNLVRFTKTTYGCVNYNKGVACSYTDDYPFFEVPIDALEEVR